MTTITYFDTYHEQMVAGNEQPGLRALCYDQQAALLESLIRPGMTVLDVGCGPALPYDTRGVYVIGLDPSAASLSVNTDVDDRIIGTVGHIPLPDQSVDLVVAFYSLHHMTGQTILDTCLMRARAFSEMGRVLKVGGQMLVFEMTPYPWAAWLQGRVWPLARRIFGSRLDAYFWTADEVARAEPFSEMQTFTCSPFVMFPPILSLPWLRIPRFLYPMTPVLYRWTKG